MSAKNMDDIAALFQKLRFKKKIIGGVDEQDVWRKLDNLQKEYRSAYEAQKVACETILRQHGIDPAEADKLLGGL